MIKHNLIYNYLVTIMYISLLCTPNILKQALDLTYYNIYLTYYNLDRYWWYIKDYEEDEDYD